MPPTYQVFCRDRQTSTTGSGVLLAIHSRLVQIGELHLEANGEMICPSNHTKGYPISNHGAACRPNPGISLTEKQCWNELDLSISKLQKNCHNILVIDFNLLDVHLSKKLVKK